MSLFLLLGAWFLLVVPLLADTVVIIGDGKVKGASEKGVSYWRGIPYAKAPVGSLRWRPPQDVEPWQGMRDATQYAASCIQNPLDLTMPQSEDCLYLNVYAPQGAVPWSLPVIVWLYGGAFARGSAAQRIWDGLVWLPKLGALPVVFVTFNHRLGVFGFLGSESLEARGALNLGLQDQRQMLTWIQRNVAAFGGNPNNVTFMAGSSGGECVVSHMLYEKGTQSLFHKAILMSGSYPSLFSGDLHTLNTAQDYFNIIAARAGCSNASSPLQCMSQVDAFTLNAAVPAESPFMKVDLGPVLAPPFFHYLPQIAVSKGLFSRIPLLVGTDVDEGRTSVQMMTIRNALELDAVVADFFPPWTAQDREAVLQLYDPLLYFSHSSSPYFLAASMLIGDVKFVCAADHLALATVKSIPQVYRYVFNFTFNSLPATHGEELPFLFPPQDSLLNPGNDIFLSAWPYFAYTSTPTRNATFWPNYVKGQGLGMDTLESFHDVVASPIHIQRCSLLRALELKAFGQLAGND